MNQRGQTRPGVGVVAGSLAYELAKKWWVLLVRGVLLILIGMLAFVSPLTWVVFVGVYALIDGTAMLISGFSDQPAGAESMAVDHRRVSSVSSPASSSCGIPRSRARR